MLDNVTAITTCKFFIVPSKYNLQKYKCAVWLLIINSRKH